MTDQAAAVTLKNVSKRFGEVRAVSDLTFSVDRGQIFGLIGPSGCGKTTTVRMINGVHAPDDGQVSVLGREQIGYMPQHFVLYPELSVWENLDFVASCYGVPMRGRGRRLAQMLDFVELTDARKTPAGQISGGMQRRLELACTLLHDPQLIIFDEPTAGIDPVLRAKFWDHFRHLRDQGRTLIVTTQYVTESEYCDVVAAMKDGRLVALGSPDIVRHLAIGGDIVHVAADALSREHLSIVEAVEGVRSVRRVGPEEAAVVVDAAGAATPRIVAALQSAGATNLQVQEQRPNFDEVFVRLMEAA